MIHQTCRLSLCLLTVLLWSEGSLAQSAPHIDHLEIDDPSGRLTIIGNFGPVPGAVEVDSINTTYSYWGIDSIVCFLPDSGRGSCGPVQVEVSNEASNISLLSGWDIDYNYVLGAVTADRGNDEHIRFRLDLSSKLHQGLPIIDSTTQSSIYITYQGPGNGAPVTYDTVLGSREIDFNLRNRLIFLGFRIGASWGTEAYVQLGSHFSVPVGLGPYMGPNENILIDGTSYFIPPDSVLQASVLPLASAFQSIRSSAYPIPANDRVRIQYNTPEVQAATTSLLDINGNVVMKDLHPKSENSDEGASIDTRGLASGTYFYVIQSNDYTTSGKFLVEH